MAAPAGLNLTCAPALRELLLTASRDPGVDEALREQAAALAAGDKVSWKQLRPVYVAIREGSKTQEGLQPLAALQASRLVLPSEPVRTRPPELEARLAKLRRADEERRYGAMVRDVTASERRAEERRLGGLVTYKDQLSYGLHVVVVMGVFYAFGHVAAARLSPKPSMRLAGGLLCLVGAMLMESVLLIIRTSARPAPAKRRPIRTTAAAAAAAEAAPPPAAEAVGRQETKKRR